ncbi:UDP-3-O-(3-hydroxymyristoyl)glucosamine N-acyltransferase [Bryocella elongata]|nr:UDP-3-O-(3-hydroxymyristoyl)glucosamine N-acyltransferase [Bryocella elongata]
MRSITVQEIVALPGMQAAEDVVATERAFSRLSGFDEAMGEAIVFAQDEASLVKALESKAGLVLAPLRAETEDVRVLRVKHPKLAFALISEWFDQFEEVRIHAAAHIDPAAKLGVGVSVGAGAVIEAGAVVGDGCIIASNVTIYGCVTLGARCLIQAGAVLGAMGFGYVRASSGRYTRFPQRGTLVIEDDVEIGANTTIDRGALGETRIGSGTKIDNLVHIGHNCNVGRNVVIASQVGISGSCVIEDGAVLAGQVGLGDHARIGPGVILGGASGVFPHKRVEGPGQMFMGVPAEPVKDYLKTIAKVRRLK